MLSFIALGLSSSLWKSDFFFFFNELFPDFWKESEVGGGEEKAENLYHHWVLSETKVSKMFVKFILKFMYVCVCDGGICIWMPFVLRGQRNWSYKWQWATWCEGWESNCFFGRTIHALHHGAISLALRKYFKMGMCLVTVSEWTYLQYGNKDIRAGCEEFVLDTRVTFQTLAQWIFECCLITVLEILETASKRKPSKAQTCLSLWIWPGWGKTGMSALLKE